MSATATVVGWLKADAGVTALVDTRIYAGALPERVALPAICGQRLTAEPFNHLRGYGDLDRTSVMVDVFAASYASAAEIQAAVRTALQSADIICETESDDFDSAVQLYRISSQWQVFT